MNWLSPPDFGAIETEQSQQVGEVGTHRAVNVERAFGVGHREARALRDALAGIAHIVQQGSDLILPGRDTEQLADYPIDQGGFVGGVAVERHPVNDGKPTPRLKHREHRLQALATGRQLRIAHPNLGGRLGMMPLALDKRIEGGEAVGGKGVVPVAGIVNGFARPRPAAGFDCGQDLRTTHRTFPPGQWSVVSALPAPAYRSTGQAHPSKPPGCRL